MNHFPSCFFDVVAIKLTHAVFALESSFGTIDMSKYRYNVEDDVFDSVGIQYFAKLIVLKSRDVCCFRQF